MNRPAHRRDRPEYSEYRERFGEDPARLLFTDMDLKPRLTAITDPDLLRAYARVEGEKDESDSELIGWLNRRIAALEGADPVATTAEGGAPV